MRQLLLCVLILAAGVAPASADTPDAPVPITVRIEDRGQLEQLSRLVSIDDVRDGIVLADATPEQLERIAAAGFTWVIREPEEAPELATMCPPGWEDDPNRSWECYPSYPQYEAIMANFAADYPALCRLVDLGPTTNQARPHRLWAVRISDSPDLEEDEPEVFYTSSIHGDEATGYILMLRLIDELLTQYGSDPEITALVDGLEIWINPAANPDGTYYTSDTTVDGAIRDYTTATGANSGVDGNRNFPDPDEGPHPDGNPWWVETEAMIAFAEARRIVLSANFHGGIEVVNYPWDTWSRRHVDDAWFVHISRAYADSAQAASPAGYMTALNNGITNGWDWYPVAGGRQDYMTGLRHGREVTIELSDTKLLPASQLDEHWSWNRDALLGYLGQARFGIHGIVTDPGGQPLDATIEIVGLDTAADNSYAVTDPDVGDYHRLLLPGTYTVRITAAGFHPAEFSGVTVPPNGATIVDAVLQPLAAATVTGEVTTHTGAPIAAATVEIPDLAVAGATGPDGRYVLPLVFEGLHRFRVGAEGFASFEVDRQVSAPAAELNFALAPTEVAVATDLELDDGGLSSSQGWQWGMPSGAGNPGAHSGSRVWATNLTGNYLPNAHWYLDLAAVPVPDSGRLTFWHFYDIEQGSSDWDGGNVSVRPTGAGTYTVIEPAGGYPSAQVVALGQPGFTGLSGGWREIGFDLTEWAGGTIDIRWHFASDSTVQELGWYLDDISVAGAVDVADFQFDPSAPAAGEAVRFTDRSTGPVTGWSWDFGDGGSSFEQNPVHAFAADGSYLVTLTVDTPTGPLTHARTVSVGAAGVVFDDGFESGSTGAWSAAVP